MPELIPVKVDGVAVSVHKSPFLAPAPLGHPLEAQRFIVRIADGSKGGKPVKVLGDFLKTTEGGRESFSFFTSLEALQRGRLGVALKRLKEAAAEGRAVKLKPGEVEAVLSAIEEGPRSVGDLLAVIHGDGGHYTAQHGLEKSAADAIGKFYRAIGAGDIPEPDAPF